MTRTKLLGTRRNTYSKAYVQEMRTRRSKLKPKNEVIPSDVYHNVLGDLQAAGHLQILGHTNFQCGITDCPNPKLKKRQYLVGFESFVEDGFEDRPHLQGYLESASNADKKPYRIKGWFNEDGTIRIELVK